MTTGGSSYVAWVDYSEKERREMLDVLSLFKQQGVLDELGIGTVRDALANVLFPGTSTIQTRLRYFLIVPWIYARVERRSWKGRTAASYAQHVEGQVTESLKRKAPGAGVIGAEVGAAVQRPASDVYWQGVGRWRIRSFRGSRERYHRWLDRQRVTPFVDSTELSEPEDSESPIERGSRWHSGLPEAPSAFPELESLNLLPIEAEYLKERILAAAPRSLLAAFMTTDIPIAGAQFPWSVPGAGAAAPDLETVLRSAQDFSECMYGAALLYNLLLARQFKGDLVETYQSRLADWGEAMLSRTTPWQLGELWQVVADAGRAPSSQTTTFIREWHRLVTEALSAQRSPAYLADDPGAHSLLRDREWSIKGPRARLDNKERGASWSGESGGAQLDFRWPVVARHIRDIREALGSSC